MSEEAFHSWPKIQRLNKTVEYTEKIDGTNGQVHVLGDGTVLAGSRNRYLEPGPKDNFGFAQWVLEHEDELRLLGTGRHYGEWWGQGIQRVYGMTTRKFSLFSNKHYFAMRECGVLPACVDIVPVLGTGAFAEANLFMESLRISGSEASPGFDKPEGIIATHLASGHRYKITFDGDSK